MDSGNNVSPNYLSSLRPTGLPITTYTFPATEAVCKKECRLVIEWFAYSLFCKIIELHKENPKRKLECNVTLSKLKIRDNTDKIFEINNCSIECIGLTSARLVIDKAIRIVQANLDTYLNFDSISLNQKDLSTVNITEDVFKNLQLRNFSPDVTLYQKYKKKKAAYLHDCKINFPLQFKKLVDWIICKLMRLIIKNSEKLEAFEKTNHRIYKFEAEVYQNPLALQTAFKTVIKAIKVVLVNLGLPPWSRAISVTTDPALVVFKLSHALTNSKKIPLSNHFNKIYLDKKELMPKLNLLFLRPSGQRLYKMNIQQKEQPIVKQRAIERYAFNLMKVILRNAVNNPGLAISLEFEPLQFSSESSSLAKSVAEEAISMVIDRFQIKTFFPCIKQKSPSLVSINISSDLVKKIKFPCPILPTTKTPSILGNLLYDESKAFSDKANPDLIMIKTKDGNLGCHSVVLKARGTKAFLKHFDGGENTMDLLSCSLKTAKVFIEWLYTDNVTLPLPETIEEATSLVTLGHEFSSSLLKEIGIKILTDHLNIYSFVDIHSVADKFYLIGLLEFCQAKLDFDFQFKDQLESHLINILSTDLAVSPKVNLNYNPENINGIATIYQLNKVLSKKENSFGKILCQKETET